MSGAPRGPKPPRRAWSGPDRSASNPWVVRGIVIVVSLVVVGAIVYSALHGFLFTMPER